MTSRTLVVATARLDGAAEAAVALGRWPRKDFFELVAALDADVIDLRTVEQHGIWRLMSKLAGAAAVQAWIAFRRRRLYDRIFCDGEHVAIPLALLLRLTRDRPRLVTLGHLLTTRTKRAVFRWLRPQAAIDLIAVHGVVQRQIACSQLGLAVQKVVLMPYQVDSGFWNPLRVGASSDPLMVRHSNQERKSVQIPSTRSRSSFESLRMTLRQAQGERGIADPKGEQELPLICSAGLEYRDYPTLIAAVRGLKAHLTIAAGSRWSRHRDSSQATALPANVDLTALGYSELRELYARSRFVVVPLREIDNPAGITTILEAMSMGKAVIVSATRGQRDVIRGRLCQAGGVSETVIGGPVAFHVTGSLAKAETGLYVPPGDPVALRSAMQFLLDHPDEAEEMGAAGRRLVEQYMNLDLFVQAIAVLVAGRSAGRIVRAPRRSSLPGLRRTDSIGLQRGLEP